MIPSLYVTDSIYNLISKHDMELSLSLTLLVSFLWWNMNSVLSTLRYPVTYRRRNNRIN